MLNIRDLFSLTDQEIRRIRLSRTWDIIRIGRFIFIIDMIQIQEIGNLHFLMGTQDFILNGN